MSDKTDRKQLRQPDEFQQIAGKVMGWLIQRQKLVLGAIALVAVAALAAWGFGTYKSNREAKAGGALAEALGLENRPVAGEGAPQPGEETFPSKDEREKAVTAALEKVRAEHGGTTAARTALAEIAFRKLRRGEAAAAQQDLEEFLKSAGNDHPLRGFATESLGYALEAQGKLEEAKAAFARLADADLKERAAFHAARIALIEGKPDARQQLEQVAKDYPKDPVALEANQRVEIASLPKADPAQAAPAEAPKAPAKGKAAGKGAAKK